MDVREKSSNENRLIDSTKLIDALPIVAEDKKISLMGAVADMVMLISEQPVIEAEPVVRCRECKYWGDEDGKLQDSDGVLFARCKVHNYLIDGRHTGWCPTENDFCSYGERKEDADILEET